jgi:CBS domain-containing protein
MAVPTWRVREVGIVKRTQHGVIPDPWTIPVTAPLAEAVEVMARHRVGTLAVVDESRKLKGLLTERDVRFVPVGNALSTPSVAARMTPLAQLVVQVVFDRARSRGGRERISDAHERVGLALTRDRSRPVATGFSGDRRHALCTA